MNVQTDVLAIGETMVMVTPATGGRLRAHGQYLLRPGGAESNVAAHLAQLGLHSAWASAVGADPLGDIVVDTLHDLGVDVTLVERDSARPTAVYFKDPTPAGTNVHYYRHGSAASALGREVLSRWTDRAPRMVHVSGITAALSPSCRDLLDAIVVDRAFGDALVSFDVNYRPALWDGEAAPQLQRLAQASDIVFVGRDEAESLWGTGSPDSVREMLCAPAHVVVKDGGREAVEFTSDGRFHAPARRVDQIIDVVGAGDAFAAGWLAAMLYGSTETLRLQVAHFVASQVLQTSTDLAVLPGIADIVALITQNGHLPPVPAQSHRGERVDVTNGGASA